MVVHQLVGFWFCSRLIFGGVYVRGYHLVGVKLPLDPAVVLWQLVGSHPGVGRAEGPAFKYVGHCIG
jgi:hypothetical protein